MSNRFSGGLLSVLRRSRVAWYQGSDGITAYYEQPGPDVPGAFFVNGRLITTLRVDQEGFYADFPAPHIQHMIVARGVDLNSGWTCRQEIHGGDINDAINQSKHNAARHHDGRISLQCVGEPNQPKTHTIVFVNGRQRWKVRLSDTARAIAELGLSASDGWYPVNYDLLRLQTGG